MSARRTIVAGVSLVILAGLVWLDSLRLETDSMASFAARTLLGMGFEEIRGVEIINAHGHFVLEHRPDGWWLTHPLETPADQERVFTILSNMADAKRFSAQSGVPEDRLADYGLDQPRTRATFRADDGRSVTIAIGAEAPSVQRFFATEVGTGEVFTVTPHVPNNLDKTLLQLRDRRLFPGWDPEQITALAVTAEGEATRIERDSDGQWMIAGADPRPADAARVASLLAGIINLRAEDFPGEGDARARGLDPPVLEAALFPVSGEALRLEIGRPRDITGAEFYARAGGAAETVTIAGRDLAVIPRRRADWLDRDLLHLAPSDVGRFSLTVAAAQSDQTLAFERGPDDRWRLVSDPDTRVNQEAAETMLQLFGNLRAEEIVTTEAVSPEPFGLGTPALTFVWHSRDGSVTERLDLGRAASSGDATAHYRRSGDGAVVIAPSCFTDALVLRGQIIDRHLVTADLRRAERIVLRRGERTFDVRLRSGVWTLLGDAGRTDEPLPAARVQAMLERLAQAEYRGALEGEVADAVRRGLATPAWALRVEDGEGAALADLRCPTLPSQAAEGGTLYLLADGERAYRVEAEQLIDVQRWLDQMLMR